MSLALQSHPLVIENMGLVHACANRFRNRGVPYDDLFQAGCVGLIKAASGFDDTRGFKFSTYAVPAILGEIKRIFRDGGSVKIGRAAKEKGRELLKIYERLADEKGREPDISEVARLAGTEVTEAALILSASLPAVSLTSREDSSENDIPVESPEENCAELLDLNDALERLNDDERQLIKCRYFEFMTQCDTAKTLGMTQVQVSRREKGILLKLRKMLEYDKTT